MWMRPYAAIIDGNLTPRLEFYVENGTIMDIRPQSGPSDPYILSPAFVNAHSHLEYRGFQDALKEPSYWPWISKLASLKPTQDLEQVRLDTLLAAKENHQTGVALIGEWSDRPYSGEAMTKAGLKGILYQEVLTVGFTNAETTEDIFKQIKKKRKNNENHYDGPILWGPHAPYTVHPETLSYLANQHQPFSIHVAETEIEDQFFEGKGGPIADFCLKYGFPLKPTGTRVFEYLEEKGIVQEGAQFVHCCALQVQDVEIMAKVGVRAAHCPRSNKRLQCPYAPIREMLDVGVLVGLGMDSPASGSTIDMFAEMRAALKLSQERRAPLSPEEVWNMATTMGALSLGTSDWKIQKGSHVPLIQIWISDAASTKDLIQKSAPELVRWVKS